MPEAVPTGVSVTPPPGYWQREASHWPQPPYPVTSDWFAPRMRGWFGAPLSEASAMIDGMEFANIGGWIYNRMIPMGGKERKPPPSWLMWAAVRITPAIRKRLSRMTAFLEDRVYMQSIDRWPEWRTDQQGRIAALRAVDTGTLTDSGLLQHLDAVFAFAEQSWARHFRLGITPVFALVDLILTCEELLGWDESRSLGLLTGLSKTSTLPAERLNELALMAANRPAVRLLTARADAAAVGELEATDPEFAAAFRAYQEEFAFRALRYEMAEPTLQEVPWLTLRLINDQLERAYDPSAGTAASQASRESAIGEVRAALEGRAADLARFESALADAARLYPVREENEFYTVSIPTALQRFALLEAGTRLARSTVIGERDDVFFLTLPDVVQALNAPRDLRPLVEERKAAMAWAHAHPGPPTYGEDLGQPPFHVLPKRAARATLGMLRMAELTFAQRSSSREQPPSNVVKGIGAAPGVYTGTVRVIMDESQFDKIQPGDVLVCPITSPVWSVLFASVGALVTDTGGILSHPAIIAREYGIPAVVATGNGTALLKDGQIVTVDGGAGTITL